MDSRNEVSGSPIEQWFTERVSYQFDFANERTEGLTTVSSPVVTLYEIVDDRERNVSATALSGAPTASGPVVTTGLVQNLTAGRCYRLECQVDSGTGRYVQWTRIIATPVT